MHEILTEKLESENYSMRKKMQGRHHHHHHSHPAILHHQHQNHQYCHLLTLSKHHHHLISITPIIINPTIMTFAIMTINIIIRPDSAATLSGIECNACGDTDEC